MTLPRRSRKRAATAALFSFLALLAAAAAAQDGKPAKAQADKPVVRPQVKVDDRWVYRRIDRRMKPPTLVYEIRVTFVDERVIHTVIERQGGSREGDATWTREWNSVNAVDSGVVEIEKGMMQFPLSVGRAYPAAWHMRRPKAGAFHVRHERDVKILGWEEVEVPAGKFRALKVQADGGYRRIDKPNEGWARNTFWYVPAVKRWVKSLYEDSDLVVTEELFFHRVQ